MAADQSKKDAVFRLIDLNSDGDVEVSELVDFMNTFGPALTKAEELKMLEMVGLKGKNRLTRADMELLFTKKIELSTPKAELLKQFQVFDPKGTGQIPFEVLVGKFCAFGENFKSEEAVRDVFKGDYLKDNRLQYVKWLDSKYGSQ